MFNNFISLEIKKSVFHCQNCEAYILDVNLIRGLKVLFTSYFEQSHLINPEASENWFYAPLVSVSP
jgi:hypothetical protein